MNMENQIYAFDFIETEIDFFKIKGLNFKKIIEITHATF